MNSRFYVYEALTKLELDDPKIRKDNKILAHLNHLGLAWESTKIVEKEWERISFIANNAFGDVLEIGCATGIVTKYLDKNARVRSILAVDILPEYANFLKQLNLEKVKVQINNLTSGPLGIASKFDCVIMTEIIEHITTEEEVSILKHIYNNISNKTRFIITTPLGFMKDPSHIRGFSKLACIIHIMFIYGNILKISNNDIQQFYIVRYRNRRFIQKFYILMEKNGSIRFIVSKLFKFFQKMYELVPRHCEP